MSYDGGVPIEVFIQAITSQLDRAQEGLALKAKFGTPLTFAVRDLALDLRTHVEVIDNEIVLRPAGPGEGDASMVRLSLTTITRPMIEENTRPLTGDDGGPSIKDALGDELTPEEQRKLEWAGVYTVSQLRALPTQASPDVIERVAQLPVSRLRSALLAASRPKVVEVRPLPNPHHVAIRGINLVPDSPLAHAWAGGAEQSEPSAAGSNGAAAPSPAAEFPTVHLNGTKLDVLATTPHEITAGLPRELPLGGALEVATPTGSATYWVQEATR